MVVQRNRGDHVTALGLNGMRVVHMSRWRVRGSAKGDYRPLFMRRTTRLPLLLKTSSEVEGFAASLLASTRSLCCALKASTWRRALLPGFWRMAGSRRLRSQWWRRW